VTGKTNLRYFVTILKWTSIVLLVAVGATYAGDYFYVRYRAARQKPGDPFEVLQFRRLYAIPQKSGKDDFSFGDPETQTCVRSLFPQAGYAPCWYAAKQVKKPIVY